jgi:hypothetical protein
MAFNQVKKNILILRMLPICLGCLLSGCFGGFQIAERATFSSAGSPVKITNCDPGFSLSQGECFANQRSCPVARGTGVQDFTNGRYGECRINTCDSGFALADGACRAQFELTLIDQGPSAYAAQQSHSQNVVSNSHGYFAAIRHGNDGAGLTTWRLLWSRDQGKTFQILYQETSYTNTPAIETDRYGNLYVVRGDEAEEMALLYVFSASNAYASEPEVIPIPDGRSSKFSMIYDPTREFLYFTTQFGRFYRIDISTRSITKLDLLVAGTHAAPQYPNLTMTPDGTLLLGWTNACGGVLPGVSGQCYLSEHYLVSWDGGISWSNFTSMLTPPLAADDTGPGVLITNVADLARSLNFASLPWSNWMDSLMYKNGKLHAMYTTADGTRYLRINPGLETEIFMPKFQAQNETIFSSGGFFAASPEPGSPVFAIAQTFNSVSGYGLGALVSRDNGVTWKDLPQINPGFNSIYAVAGARTITTDGFIIGAMSDYKKDDNKLYFFRIKVQ